MYSPKLHDTDMKEKVLTEFVSSQDVLQSRDETSVTRVTDGRVKVHTLTESIHQFREKKTVADT